MIFYFITYCRCAGCKGVFAEKEIVQRIGGGGSYHSRCLRCSQCRAELKDGDSMGLGASGALLCEEHALRSIEVSGDLMRCGRPIPRKVGVWQSLCGPDAEKTVAKLGVPCISPISSEDMVSLRGIVVRGY